MYLVIHFAENSMQHRSILLQIARLSLLINQILLRSMMSCAITHPQCVKKAWEISNHDDVIEWKHFPRYWPFVRGIHRSPVNSPHKGQWRGTLMFSFICTWINVRESNREAGDLRRHDGPSCLLWRHYSMLRWVWWALIYPCLVVEHLWALYITYNKRYNINIYDKKLAQYNQEN